MLVERMEQMVRIQVGYAEEDGKIAREAVAAEKDEEIQRLQRQIQDLARGSSDTQRLRDEIEMLKERTDAAEKSEMEVMKLRKRLQDFDELKRQYKELSDSNKEYVDKNIELEEAVKTIPFLKVIKYDSKPLNIDVCVHVDTGGRIQERSRGNGREDK